jgi:hypothetical protein
LERGDFDGRAGATFGHFFCDVDARPSPSPSPEDCLPSPTPQRAIHNSSYSRTTKNRWENRLGTGYIRSSIPTFLPSFLPSFLPLVSVVRSRSALLYGPEVTESMCDCLLTIHPVLPPPPHPQKRSQSVSPQHLRVTSKQQRKMEAFLPDNKKVNIRPANLQSLADS